MTRLANGKIVVTYRHTKGTGKPGVPGQMWAAYRTSSDNGATWSAEKQYGPTPTFEMAYSTPIEYAPNNVVFIWANESNGYNSRITINYVNF